MREPGFAERGGVSFTLSAYEEILDALRAAGYESVGFDRTPRSGEVVLRHDVDISVRRALAMARAEAAHGFTATYFLQLTTPVYNLLDPQTRLAVRRIQDLGHEIGLHFDAHYHWDGRPTEAALTARVDREREILGRLTDARIETVSFHVPDEWVLGVDFDGFVNAYSPPFFEAIEYVSDSNQKWRDGRPFADGFPDAFQVLVHPGLWHERDREMDDIVASLADYANAVLDDYLSLLGV